MFLLYCCNILCVPLRFLISVYVSFFFKTWCLAPQVKWGELLSLWPWKVVHLVVFISLTFLQQRVALKDRRDVLTSMWNIVQLFYSRKLVWRFTERRDCHQYLTIVSHDLRLYYCALFTNMVSWAVFIKEEYLAGPGSAVHSTMKSELLASDVTAVFCSHSVSWLSLHDLNVFVHSTVFTVCNTHGVVHCVDNIRRDSNVFLHEIRGFFGWQ